MEIIQENTKNMEKRIENILDSQKKIMEKLNNL